MARFEILGPLSVRGPRGALEVRGRQQRLALALLLVSDGDVSRAALIDGLWPTDPPPAARQTVESVVSRLRSALRRGSSATLDATPAGYRLVLGPDDVVDAQEFATLAAQANARVRQDPAAAAAAAREALSLWRGPALQDLADEPALHAEATRMDEERLRIFELWARAQIDLDLAQQLVPELSREARLHPYRESLHMLLMLALYRCGRQADALATFTALRTHLADELGIVPGSSARRLQQQILEHDPALEPPAERGPEAAAAPISPTAPPRAGRRPRRLVAVVAAVALVGPVVVALTAGGGGPDALRTVRSPTVVAFVDGEGSLATITSTPTVTTRLATGADALWATAFDDGTLLRIDSGRHAVTQTIRVGRSALGVAVAAGDVWVVDALDSVLVRVDPETSSVVQRIQVGTGASEVAAAAGRVWIADGRGGTVTRVDAHTGSVVGVTRVGAEAAGIAADEHGVWVAEHGANAVARLDPQSGKLVDEVHVGSGPSAVAIGPAGVWVTNELDSTVSLIDPARDVVTLTRAVDGVPRIAAADARGLWVASGDAPAVTRVGPDGSSRLLTLSAELTALARDGPRILASVRPLGANHRGGTLSIRVAIHLASADPYQCCDMPPNMRGLAWDGLLGLSTVPGSIGRLVPDLAVAIPRPRAGGRAYTFTLRPGLRYDTGAPVRARDVRIGLERAASSSDIWAAYLSALPGATRCPGHPTDCDLSAAVVTDDRARTVTLRLARADPLLLPSLALPVFTPSPRPTGPVPAIGPYRLTRFVPDRLVEFRRNPAFRAPAPAAQPRAFPDVIRWSLGSDPESNVAAVEAGRADYTFDPPSREQRRDIAVQSARQLHTNPLAGIAFLVLNTRHAPFDDARVRRALNLATDRGFVARALTGRSDTVLCQTLPRGIAGHRPYCPYTRRPASGRWRGSDLARARRLVNASGTAGANIDVFAQPVPEEAPVGRYFRGLLRRLGYRPHLIRVTGERRDALLRRGAPDAMANVWIADFPSAAQWITLLLACRAWDPPALTNNHAEFCDPRVDRLARAAAKLEPSNPAAAARLWARADRRVTDAAPWVPLAQVVSTEVVSRRVGNFRFAATSGAMLSQLWVR